MNSRILRVLHSQPPQQGTVRVLYGLARSTTRASAYTAAAALQRAQASCLPVHLLVMSVLVAVMCFRIFFRTVRTIAISGIAPLWDRA